MQGPIAELLSGLGLGGVPGAAQNDGDPQEGQQQQQQQTDLHSQQQVASETAADMLEQLQGLSTQMRDMQGSVNQLSSRLGGAYMSTTDE